MVLFMHYTHNILYKALYDSSLIGTVLFLYHHIPPLWQTTLLEQMKGMLRKEVFHSSLRKHMFHSRRRKKVSHSNRRKKVPHSSSRKQVPITCQCRHLTQPFWP